MTRGVEPLRRVLDVSSELAELLDVGDLLRTAARHAREITELERACVVLREGREVRVAAESTAVEEARGLPVARSLIRRALQSGRSVGATTTEDGRESGTESMQALRLRTVLCVPLVGRDGATGALYADSRLGVVRATHGQLAVLELLASQLAVMLDSARLRRELRAEADRLRSRLRQAYAFESLVGSSPAMKQVFQLLRRLQSIDSDVLITGETGTGKELAAKVLHFSGLRGEGPLVELNCAALPESLVDAELFGIERRVATGVEARTGRVERARGGSLLLDEVGDLTPQLQVKLLRFLQDRTYRRVGSTQDRQVDVRILAATNKVLEREVETGRFRADLYYRLEALRVVLPPLRAREGDALLLAYHFLKQIRQRHQGLTPRGLSPDAEAWIAGQPWPGNVRQLQQCIRSAAILSEKRLLESTDLQPGGRPAARRSRSLPDRRDGLTRRLLEAALSRSGGNVKEAASELGIARKTLYEKARRVGLEVRRRSD